MRYAFDENDSVIGFSLWSGGWQHYYFVKNLQGDVIRVYKAANNTLVASYTYDSWGNVLSATGELATINPFRYRGYYYDNESWFYYLNSRYYDPAIGRFINADAFASTGQSFIGYNMFVYCGNNPVTRTDDEGNFWNWAVGAIIGGVIGAVSALVTGSGVTDVLIGAVSGAVSGAIIAGTGNSVLGRAAGSAINAAGAAYSAYRNGATDLDTAVVFGVSYLLTYQAASISANPYLGTFESTVVDSTFGFSAGLGCATVSAVAAGKSIKQGVYDGPSQAPQIVHETGQNRSLHKPNGGGSGNRRGSFFTVLQ